MKLNFSIYSVGNKIPQKIVLGLKAHILVKFCKKLVKTPHFMVVKYVGVISHKGLSALSFVK